MNASNRLAVLAADIQAAHRNIRASAKQMAERAITAGNLLIEAKVSLKHGTWHGWLADHVGISERTARRYMQIARSGLETATVADLGIRGAAEAIARHKDVSRSDLDDAHGWPLPAASGGWVHIQMPGEANFALVWRDQHDPEGSFDFIAMAQAPAGERGPAFAAIRPMRAYGIARALDAAGFKLSASKCDVFSAEMPGEWRGFVWDFQASVFMARSA